MRTFTYTAPVYLTNTTTFGLKPEHMESRSDEELAKQLQISLYHVKEWTRVGSAEVTITLDDGDKLIQQRVESLRARRESILQEANLQAAQINNELNSLLALENKS